jgi:hypothetical protein
MANRPQNISTAPHGVFSGAFAEDERPGVGINVSPIIPISLSGMAELNSKSNRSSQKFAMVRK